MKKKQYTKSLELIDKIQKIRSKNNKNWMDLLRLSFKLDPKTSSEILSQIFFDDQKISNLAKKLYLLNKEK